jgi:ABC-2 type transport system ATP-binding protein
MRQKVAICCGYLHRPRAVLLDEPMTGLDPRGIRTMKASILDQARTGTAFIISSHLLSVVEGLCRSVLIMDGGRPVERGKIADLRRRPADDQRAESLEEVFFRVIDAPAAAEGSPAGTEGATA